MTYTIDGHTWISTSVRFGLQIKKGQGENWKEGWGVWGGEYITDLDKKSIAAPFAGDWSHNCRPLSRTQFT